MAARISAVVAAGTLLLCAGCATVGGVQVEGPASQVKPPPASPPPASGQAPSADAVAVLRADPLVGEKVKLQLKPCADGRYTVDERFEDLTGDGTAELLVTVGTCPSRQSAPNATRGVLASYIYDLSAAPAKRLFGTEEPGSGLKVEPGIGFTLSYPVYEPADRPCCPSGAEVTVYRWNGTAFEEFKK